MHNKELNDAYLAGFMASGEGWNGEFPFDDQNKNPEDDENWLINRDKNIEKLTKKLQLERGK